MKESEDGDMRGLGRKRGKEKRYNCIIMLKNKLTITKLRGYEIMSRYGGGGGHKRSKDIGRMMIQSKYIV